MGICVEHLNELYGNGLNITPEDVNIIDDYCWACDKQTRCVGTLLPSARPKIRSWEERMKQKGSD